MAMLSSLSEEQRRLFSVKCPGSADGVGADQYMRARASERRHVTQLSYFGAPLWFKQEQSSLLGRSALPEVFGTDNRKYEALTPEFPGAYVLRVFLLPKSQYLFEVPIKGLDSRPEKISALFHGDHACFLVLTLARRLYEVRCNIKAKQFICQTNLAANVADFAIDSQGALGYIRDGRLYVAFPGTNASYSDSVLLFARARRLPPHIPREPYFVCVSSLGRGFSLLCSGGIGYNYDYAASPSGRALMASAADCSDLGFGDIRRVSSEARVWDRGAAALSTSSSTERGQVPVRGGRMRAARSEEALAGRRADALERPGAPLASVHAEVTTELPLPALPALPGLHSPADPGSAPPPPFPRKCGWRVGRRLSLDQPHSHGISFPFAPFSVTGLSQAPRHTSETKATTVYPDAAPSPCMHLTRSQLISYRGVSQSHRLAESLPVYVTLSRNFVMEAGDTVYGGICARLVPSCSPEDPVLFQRPSGSVWAAAARRGREASPLVRAYQELVPTHVHFSGRFLVACGFTGNVSISALGEECPAGSRQEEQAAHHPRGRDSQRGRQAAGVQSLQGAFGSPANRELGHAAERRRKAQADAAPAVGTSPAAPGLPASASVAATPATPAGSVTSGAPSDPARRGPRARDEPSAQPSTFSSKSGRSAGPSDEIATNISGKRKVYCLGCHGSLLFAVIGVGPQEGAGGQEGLLGSGIGTEPSEGTACRLNCGNGEAGAPEGPGSSPTAFCGCRCPSCGTRFQAELQQFSASALSIPLLRRLLELLFACMLDNQECRARSLLQALFSRNAVAVIGGVTLDWLDLPLARGVPDLRRLHAACGYTLFLALLVLAGAYPLVLPLAQELVLALGTDAPQVLAVCYGALDAAISEAVSNREMPDGQNPAPASVSAPARPQAPGDFTTLVALKNALLPCAACAKLQDNVFYPLLFNEEPPGGPQKKDSEQAQDE